MDDKSHDPGKDYCCFKRKRAYWKSWAGPMGWTHGLGPWAGPMGWADGLGVITGEHKVSTHKLCLCLRSAQYLTCGVCFLCKVIS